MPTTLLLAPRIFRPSYGPVENDIFINSELLNKIELIAS